MSGGIGEASAGALAAAMRRVQELQNPNIAQEENPEYAPYAPQGGVLDWISSLLPDWLSGRSAVMQNRQRLAQMDAETEE